MKLHYPNWFPYPSCWLNSLLLLLLLSGIAYAIQKIPNIVNLQYFQPGPLAILAILLLLCPILLITLIHHLLHLLIGHLFPKIQAPEIGDVKGLIPGVFSWWEGIYGWAVMAISSLACIIFVGAYSIATENPTNFSDEVSREAPAILGVIWLTIGAYLYQLFHLVEQRLILVGRNLQNPYNARKKE